MKRFLISIVLLFAPLAPAQSYWEYGHQTVAQIAQANMSPMARANMRRLLRAAPMLGTPACAMRNIADVSVWADCIKGDRVRWGYTNSWHYQNVDICKPFDLKSACADGNCVSAQIDRNFALLSNKALPTHHQPLHAGDHADRGGNDLKTTYGVMPGYNLHSVWDGLLADRALSAAPAIVRTFAPAGKAAVDQGNAQGWSEENWAISKNIAYPRAVDGDPCGAKPAAPVVIDEADVTASRAALRQQVERGGIRLARLLEQALR
jgi:hypothetical protein